MRTLRRLFVMSTASLVLLGCGMVAGPTPSPTALAIEHKTGERDVVLRYESGGGFVPWHFFLTQTPVFTLYGDGTVIYRNTLVDPPAPEGTITRNVQLRTLKLDEARVQSLLRVALLDSGLGVARPRYEYGAIADAPWSTFTVRAGGLDKTVEVYALGIEGPDVPDAQIRAALARLAAHLVSWEALSSVQTSDYAPERYRGILTPDEGLGAALRDWPWATIKPADFMTPNDPNGPQVPVYVMTPDELAQLGLANLEGGARGIVLRAPDGTTHHFAVRPLLPDEAR